MRGLGGWIGFFFLFLFRGGVRGEARWQSGEIGASLNPEAPPQDSLVEKTENVGI